MGVIESQKHRARNIFLNHVYFPPWNNQKTRVGALQSLTVKSWCSGLSACPLICGQRSTRTA